MFVLHPDVIVVFKHFFGINSVLDEHLYACRHPNGADQ